MPVIYRLLQQEPGEHEWVQPRGEKAEVDIAWDALDWVRLRMEKPWGASFRVTFGKLLPLRERLAIPGSAQRARFVGGDATLERLGAADWKTKQYHIARCDHYLPALAEVTGPGGHAEIIAVCELLC